MWKLLFIIALTITGSLSEAVSTDNKTSSRMDQEVSSSMDDQGFDMPLFQLGNVLEACNTSFRTESSFMKDLQQSGSFADETVKTAKCYVRCLLDLTGVTEMDDGKYDPELAAILFHTQTNDKEDGEVEEMAKACMENRVETCPCDRAYQFVKCLRQMKIQKYGSET